jgi:hypothetical protein
MVVETVGFYGKIVENGRMLLGKWGGVSESFGSKQVSDEKKVLLPQWVKGVCPNCPSPVRHADIFFFFLLICLGAEKCFVL